MITEKEYSISNESYTKKDFYQIYPEILDGVRKITERYDPTSSNESDPGVVILKYLATVADKLNFNIDKNILELFMPSATQDSSMRKLCDTMGYDMRYYQSATTEISFMYQGDLLNTQGNSITLPKYTTSVQNSEKSINYVLLEDVVLSSRGQTVKAEAIEGEFCSCYAGDSNVIKLFNLDDNHRFYLPETQIAENGIFIRNVGNDILWTRVSNLNTQKVSSEVWKFGYSSKRKLPYIQFPDDIASLIKDGLTIDYIRTKGVNGNISAQSITVFNSSIKDIKVKSDIELKEKSETLVEEDFKISNLKASTNGYDPESIDSAYSSFKKTVGTFDTLVTCRDYVNKIYEMLDSYSNPLVSNIQVSDIRDDINRASTVTTFSSYGISYKDAPERVNEGTSTNPKWADRINHFDLICYPFRPIKGAYNKKSFENSFTTDVTNWAEIKARLDDSKTVAHSLKLPTEGKTKDLDIVAIKNLLDLKAKISTTKPVDEQEEQEILNNIHTAIYKNFNMREMEWGEPIVFDHLLEVIEGADVRIKNVALDEPEISTAFLDTNNVLYTAKDNSPNYGLIRRRLACKNILAGRVSLFNYYKDYPSTFGEALARKPEESTEGGESYYESLYEKISEISTDFKLTAEALASKPYTLKENEIIQFEAPNFVTTLTYPAYINYSLHLNAEGVESTPAQFKEINKDTVQSILQKNSIETWGEAMEFRKSLPLYIRTNAQFHQPGYLVDSFGYKYKLVDTPASFKSMNEMNYYVPEILHIEQEKTANGLISKYPGKVFLLDSYGHYIRQSSTSVGSTYLIADMENNLNQVSLGKDKAQASIKKDESYKLKENDVLYINYTDSNDNVWNVKYTHNNVYKNGVPLYKEVDNHISIIKPTFELKDSEQLHSDTGKSFAVNNPCEDWNINGMYSLGSNEQIDIREKKEVVISKPIYCYWTLNRADNNLDHAFGEQLTYTLQDGELFFYTDESKTDLSILGSGTKLIKSSASVNFCDAHTDYSKGRVDPEEVMELGEGAAIPWVRVQLDNGNFFNIVEMQYITLTEGDSIQNCSNGGVPFDISSTPLPCDAASYIIDENLMTLPEISIDGCGWKVKSRFDLNCGPQSKQKINPYDSIILNPQDSTKRVEIKGNNSESYGDLYIKCNYLLQKAGGSNIDTSITLNDEVLNDLSIKVFNYTNPKGYKTLDSNIGTDIPLDVFDNYYTRVSFENYAKINFPVMIPQHVSTLTTRGKAVKNYQRFGLLMVYYDSIKDGAIITASSNDIRFYNEEEASSYSNKLRLKKGINTIQIQDSTTLTIQNIDPTLAGAEADTDGLITLGHVEVVNLKDSTGTNTQGINIKVLDLETSEIPAVLDFIRENATVEKEDGSGSQDIFYYNYPAEGGSVIDINEEAGETLNSANSWYDYNNIANKLVISEINAETLDAGITLTKSSKLKR